MKVIAFSLWGNNPKYLVGAIKNAELARQIFPDWICVFYIGASVSIEVAEALLAVGNTCLYTMDEPEDWRGMFWRFKAASISNVDVMISRDCDSRLSLREKAAVDEWLASDKQWHIMRDHPWHGSLMLGGMWGVKGHPQMKDWISSWKAEDRYQTDQDFLQQMVYPTARHDVMIHASFCAIEPDSIPFPTRRDGLEFVGQVFDENDITVSEHQDMLRKAMRGQGEIVRTPDFLK